MCCDNFDGNVCCVCQERKLTVVKEKKCEYRLVSTMKKRICKIHIDDCLITNGIKCDYLLIDCNEKNAYFIELKGSDFLHAINQLDRSIDYLDEEISGCSVFARIVLTKVNVPNLKNNPNILRFEKKLKKRGGDLRKMTIKMEERI